MTTLYFDIETLPADESSREVLEYLCEKKKKPEDFDDFFSKTSFDGAFGRVICIAYAIDDKPVEVICNDGDEKKTIEEFWNIAKDCDLFVGHNVMDFDLRFIHQRSVVFGIPPTKDLSFARYRNYPIFDTMKEWSKWGQTNYKLEHIALALGIPSPKDGIDGSEVFDTYINGGVSDICEYCKKDVECTRAVYKRMTFSQ